jgi:hypothetical protein
MATNPNFTSTPRATVSRIAAVNTARDGSGTIGTTLIPSFSAGTNGSRLDFITFTSSQATLGTSALRIMRVFLTDTSGLNPRIISEISLPAVTSTATVAGATVTITFTNGLVIGAGQIIYTAQSVWNSAADNTDVLARGGDF